MKLLTISGSLRTGSLNTKILAHAEGIARRAGHQVRRFDRLVEVPPFNEDNEWRPEPVIEDMRVEVRGADAVLFATPEYSGSIPGQLKNLLDWAARPEEASVFSDMPVAVISASPGRFGAAWGRETAEHVLIQMGANVQPTGWGLPRAHEWEDHGEGFIDDDAESRLRTIIGRLADRRNPTTSDQGAELAGTRRRIVEHISVR